MKKLILGLIILNANISYSQNWKCIKTDAQTFYSDGSAEIHPIRIDSTITRGDTLDYFSYQIIRDYDNFYCLKRNGATWLGEKFSVKPDGKNIFFNRFHKPIVINTKAILNESWPVYTYSNNCFIEAKISSLDTISFLGLTDSIKTIIFQCKDQNGNPINSSIDSDSIYKINHCSLKLSKNYGLIRILDFYRFPDYTSPENFPYFDYSYNYNLIGISNPQIGYQNVTAKDIFNFAIGDEIHTDEFYELYYPPYPMNGNGTKKIQRYLNKTVSLNNDTTTYLIERCIRYYHISQDTIFDGNSVHDTVIVKFILSDSTNRQYDCLPYEPYKSYTDMLSFNTAIHNSKFIDGANSFYYQDTCLNQIIDGGYGYEYIKGLGGPYYEYWGMGDFNVRKIVYYKKGTITWGTPYICSVLINIDKQKIEKENILNIYPNPTNNILNIDTENPRNESQILQIINTTNQIVYSTKFNNHLQIDVSEFAKGLYVVRVFNNEEIQMKKIIFEK